MSEQKPVCGFCGAPATNDACDVYSRYDILTGGITYSPGERRLGCDLHPAKSRTIDISTPFLDAMTWAASPIEDGFEEC